MTLFSNIKNTSFIINLLVFLGLFFVVLQPLAWDFELPAVFWIRQCFQLLLWITLYFLVSKVYIPKFLFRDRLSFFFFMILVSVLFIVVASRLLEMSLDVNEAMRAIKRPVRARPKHSTFSIDYFLLFISISIAGISASIAIIRKWYADNQSRLLLEQEKITAELSFLKAQINPHFFFNTLNNIYSLNRTDTEKAGDAIYTLSHMMRYVLYDSKNNTTLKKEISFVENYLKLMQLRLTEKVKIVFEKSDSNSDHSFAPMLFLPYIENAFKHGISSTENTSIYIGISSTKDTVTIEVRNTLVSVKGEIMEESNGIGLVNTKRRLDLLYPGRYTLTIDPHTSENEYFVRLILKLND
ncbi:MAG TPA: sensor histidine kinase [Sphingobacteriaceae bacterium]|nr:sensor histidine kinase [Sphingobacteriaceae bacterium]